MKPLRILVADDHEIIRHGLVSLLSDHEGWRVVAQAETGDEAVRLAVETEPHVVVMDMTMPQLNGLEATRQILQALPKTEILILTVHESEELVRQVTEAGAHGFVLKNDAGRVLVQAVESLADHKPFFTAKIESLMQDVESGVRGGGDAKRAKVPRLTPREREIVQLIAEGRSNKEIGDKLYISVRTVETHRMNIMRKLNIQSISELVRYAIRNHIIEP